MRRQLRREVRVVPLGEGDERLDDGLLDAQPAGDGQVRDEHVVGGQADAAVGDALVLGDRLGVREEGRALVGREDCAAAAGW